MYLCGSLPRPSQEDTDTRSSAYRYLRGRRVGSTWLKYTINVHLILTGAVSNCDIKGERRCRGLYLSSRARGTPGDSHSCLGQHTLHSCDSEGYTQLECNGFLEFSALTLPPPVGFVYGVSFFLTFDSRRHLVRSSVRTSYPTRQVQLKPPGWFTHSCSQPPFAKSLHSFTSYDK